MDAQILNKYRYAFGKLRPNSGRAPHKPILLMSVLDEIGRGHITDNEIILTRELVAAFDNYWEALPPPPGVWHKRIDTPYHRLVQQGFWHLFKDGRSITRDEAGQPHSIPDARSRIHYVRLDDELWQLLQNPTYRETLHSDLLQNYFGINLSRVQPIVTADQIAIQIDKLIADAQSKLKPKVAKEVKEGDEEYMRRELFRDVIYKVYDNTCAACGLKVRVGSSRVIAASHIRQFSLFGDNHPSNGLALCHNHHWAFDRGGFSISDDYKLLVSPKMTGTTIFVTAGASIHLPAAFPEFNPDPAALAWHRDNRLQK